MITSSSSWITKLFVTELYEMAWYIEKHCILNFFTEMCIEQSSTFHMTFVQIGVFDWLLGRQKGSIVVKMFKHFSGTIWRMKPKRGILAYNITLYKSYVFISV